MLFKLNWKKQINNTSTLSKVRVSFFLILTVQAMVYAIGDGYYFSVCQDFKTYLLSVSK